MQPHPKVQLDSKPKLQIFMKRGSITTFDPRVVIFWARV